MYILNEGYPLDIFTEYSKKSSKYDEVRNRSRLQSYKKCEDGLKKATLYKFLKEDNINIFHQMQLQQINIFKLAQDLTQNIIADYYYNLEPNKYARSEKLAGMRITSIMF